MAPMIANQERLDARRLDALVDAQDHLTIASSRLRAAGFPTAADRVDSEASRVKLARLAGAHLCSEVGA